MQYHDDGEKQLDDLVSTWSLGAPAEMFFRMKKKYAHPRLEEGNYNPRSEVVMGSDFWAERLQLNALHNSGMTDAYNREKSEFFRVNRNAMNKNNLSRWCLRLELNHGDFVVMHGARIHTAYEVGHCDEHINYRARR